MPPNFAYEKDAHLDHFHRPARAISSFLKSVSMKRLLFLFSFIAMFAMAVASSSQTQVNLSELEPLPTETTVIDETASAEEGIGCKKYNDDGKLIAKCFICNCSTL